MRLTAGFAVTTDVLQSTDYLIPIGKPVALSGGNPPRRLANAAGVIAYRV